MPLSEKKYPYPVISLAQTDSTNQYLNELCHKSPYPLEELTTVCAEYQTAGKGQRGNSWEAEKGKNLLFSFVLYPTFMEAGQQFILSQIISLAIKETLDKIVEDICIKWPNDIYWKEKKICGILIENDLQERYIGRSIIGVGLNVNQEQFQSDAPNPISLKQITGQEHDRDKLLSDILIRVYEYYHRLQTEAPPIFRTYISAHYTEALFRHNGWHLYTNGYDTFLARIICVEPDGHLVLEDEKKNLHRYLFKEVQYVLQ